ncbi:Histone transcription regulator 3 [Podila epicladia]|nr:Histone transcription regulator 3 [Podila epicladia]
MIRFTVLNEEEQTKSKEEESVEIQAEKCLGVYQSAIRLLQKGKDEEARRLLQNLIESDLLQKIDNDSELAARGTPLRLLQYLVYTNYASILEQSPGEAAGSALQYYLKAMTFDNSDSSLWIKIGTLAAKEKRWKLARYALECGLVDSQPEGDTTPHDPYRDFSEDQDLTPSQWSCLETLCEVLFEIGDFAACQEYVKKALQISPYFQRGLLLRQKMEARLGSGKWKDMIQASGDEPPAHRDAVTRELTLEDPGWLTLGELLLEEYKNIEVTANGDFYSKRLVIRIQKEEHSEEDVEMGDAVDSVEPVVTATEVSAEPCQPMEDVTAATVSGDSEAAVPAEDGEQSQKDSADADPSAALKRKRKEVEERSGLRTSKRVRDKLDQFEVTKKKRQEEEQEILAKYRIVLSKFGMDLDNAYIGCNSADALQLTDIFPRGLSPLLTIFNKHLERPNSLVQASTMDNNQQQKTNHFAIFTLDKSDSPANSSFDSGSALEAFVDRTNKQNSGVVEYMCAFVMAVMSGLSEAPEQCSFWQKKWPEDLRPIVGSIIAVVEEHIVEYLSEEYAADDQAEATAQRIKLEASVLLSIAEMYLDDMVSHILQPHASSTRRGRVLRKLDAEQTISMEKKFQKWLFLAGLGEIPLDNMGERWTRTIILRLEWMLGRHEQCFGNATEAISHFDRCLAVYKIDPSLTISLPNCKYDTIIDEATVQERRRKLHTHQYVLDAERLFNESEYQDVMTRLEPIFLPSVGASPSVITAEADDPQGIASSTIGGSLSERLELMGLLYKSSEALGERSKQFRCVTEMFTGVVESLMNSVTEKTESSETWLLFSQASQLLLLLRETLQSSPLSCLLTSLEPKQLQKLVCCVLAIARLGFVNILHQDRLVDDDIKISYSDLLKNRPHLEQFNLVLIRVWLVLLLILPGWLQEQGTESSDDSDTNKSVSNALPLDTVPLDIKSMDLEADTVQRVLVKPLTSNSSTPLGLYTVPSQELYMELIALIHDDLGVREICGIDSGQLIKLALKVSSPMQGAFYRKEENQCYYCIYGISLSVDGQYPIEHSSEPVDFDRQAATEFFPLLERSLSDRALRGQVRNDIKDAVDRVEEALGPPPYESNAILTLNQQLVDSYLASEINFADVIQVNSHHKLPTMTQPPSSKLPSVYRKIYAIQGKIFLAQFKNKAKNNQFKPLEDLQHAIDQFRIDIHVNPDCWDSWYALAICYAYLADENLVFSASDIRNNYAKIKDLHKRSFLCFSQAVRLAPKRAKADLNGTEKLAQDVQPKIDPGTQSEETTNGADDEDEGDGDALSSSEDSATGQDDNSEQEWHQKQSAFWFDFGNLTYGILCKPVRMEAMRRSSGILTLTASGKFQSVEIPEPTEEQVYTFAAFCFNRSLRLNRQNWRTFFMLGKCIEKLNGKPHQVLSLYQTAADLVPARTGQPGNERIFEPAYKLISTLTKHLAADKITPATVETVMKRSLAKSKLIVVEGESFIFEPPEEFLQPAPSDSVTEQDLKKDKLHAFRLLCEGLARIRHADKRHWHHRPVFRQAWILYHIYHDVERAKTEMLSLFQVKSNLKTLVSSVWKPEFERSGKHFVYVGEYTKLLIVLAKETKDVETLNSLARKIRRANGLLLDLKDIWELLYDSYLEVLADLVGPDPVLAVAEVIPRTEFRDKAAFYETKMFELEPKPAGLIVLQRLCELKKLNDKMVAEGQMGHLLAVCYSKLFLQVGGTDLYPKELIRQHNGEQDSGALETTTQPSSQSQDTRVAENKADEKHDQEESDNTAGVNGSKTGEEHEDISLKMSKLTTTPVRGTPEKSAATLDPDQQPDANENKAPTSSESTAPNDGETSSSTPATADTSSAMDVDANIEDWKTRKKISEAELASRATTMCKAPPPSLKAPQTIQSRLAGPSAPTSEDTTSPAVGPNGEATDVPVATAEGNEPDGQNQDDEGGDSSEAKESEHKEPDQDMVTATQDERSGEKGTEGDAIAPPSPLLANSRRNSHIDEDVVMA